MPPAKHSFFRFNVTLWVLHLKAGIFFPIEHADYGVNTISVT